VPDGAAVLALSNPGTGVSGIVRMTATGTMQGETLRTLDLMVLSATFTADGSQAVVTHLDLQEGESELLVFDTGSEEDGRSYLPSLANGAIGRLSPDGRWLAFESEDSGSEALYVDRFPAPAGPTAIAAGTSSHTWSADSRHLYFIDDGRLMEVSIAGGGAPVVGEPRAVVELPEDTTVCQPAPDGRFLCMATMPDDTEPVINVVVNPFGGGGR
jgi:Tol biopolymer transport system component